MEASNLDVKIVCGFENYYTSPEVIMQNHVKYNGKLYFLEKETMKVKVFRYETIDMTECPEPALKELIRLQAGISVDLDAEAGTVENS